MSLVSTLSPPGPEPQTAEADAAVRPPAEPAPIRGADRGNEPRWYGQQAITALIVFGPLIAVLVLAAGALGRGITLSNLVLAVVLFAISGHGVTAGFHRLLTHRSFKAARWLKITLAVAGSLALEGSVNSWVANHRRHHAYTDRKGDPHSPFEYGTTAVSRLRGAAHAHIGWLFKLQPTDEARWAPDLVRDRDLVIISRLFPLWAVASFALPTLVGWALSRSWAGALGGLVWGGAVRIFVLHHATFGVNSACHLWGRRPFVTRESDRATNFAPLAVLAMGENWHNFHHSCPRSARHGVDKGQLDSTARLIRILEKLGAVHDVRWPDRTLLHDRRRDCRSRIVGTS
jgi:stearoyl-CoA desaturase (delta-9 desaturase)